MAMATSGVSGLRIAAPSGDCVVVGNLINHQPRSRHSVWIPAPILELALPAMVNEFQKSCKVKNISSSLVSPVPVSGAHNCD
jgi:hypothetical protein